MRSVSYALIALLTVVLLLLTSCEGDGKEANSKASAEEPTVETAAAPTEESTPTEEKTATTQSGIIELPPVDV